MKKIITIMLTLVLINSISFMAYCAYESKTQIKVCEIGEEGAVKFSKVSEQDILCGSVSLSEYKQNPQRFIKWQDRDEILNKGLTYKTSKKEKEFLSYKDIEYPIYESELLKNKTIINKEN